ncbi:hypothetical protein EMELA_v1c06670 [Mesoplasma melaleucae]|uniref:Uncharacterized protein n=1 Tax=Mesoplasma melaleucae TaxID=81459 RepID=A0A2K8NWR2_9MOLU|nr:hypothetical protein EMELA_v1c06670 [Mesoplasma melaleucae]
MEILDYKEFKKPLKYKDFKNNYDFKASQNFMYISILKKI